MFSRLVPPFLYTDVSPDVVETDLDVVSDLWNMDGREVYRGTRDPRYTHANVYWLYDDSMERVGCAEHSLRDHAEVRLLWFRDDEFGTLLQEDGWTTDGDLWSKTPRQTFERAVNEGWTTPQTFLVKCLNGPSRIVTPEMVIKMPTFPYCYKCDAYDHGDERMPVTFPKREKVLFVDSDLIVHVPPPKSSVWSYLGLTPPPCDDGSSACSEAAEPLREAQ
jgi:hypothetical protein